MSLSKTFYFAFLRQLLLEVKQCYPEYSLEHEFRALQELEADEDYSLVQHVVTLSSIGKEIDRALISGDEFKLDNSGLVPGYFSMDSTPFLLGGLFHELFIGQGGGSSFHRSRYIADSRGRCVRTDCNINQVESVPTDIKTVQSVSSSVYFLRQFYLAFSKVSDIECIAEEKDEWEAFRSRVSTLPCIRLSGAIVQNARNLLSLVFCPKGQLHERLVEWLNSPIGFHGPGAVAGKEKGKDKWFFKSILGQHLGIFESQTSVMNSKQAGQPVSRATMVPKDFRKHRIICIEPKEFMFEQQGLWMTIAKIVSSSPLTSSSIDFSDQTVSQRMCRDFRRFSTIDLSDASDLLSMRLARLILPREVLKILGASRSRMVNVNGQNLAVSSLFTMGNALCFPLETLIFWALSNAAILFQDGVTIRKDCDPQLVEKLLGRNVRVFGDDIITRRCYFDTVVDALLGAGLKPNAAKCCHNTPVREACGAWWYAMVDCRIVRLAKANSTSLTDWCGGLEQAKAFASQGLKGVSLLLLDHLNDIWPVPYGYFGLPGQRGDIDRKHIRRNNRLQRMEFEMPVLTGTTIQPVTGERGLYAYFTGSATTASITRALKTPKICWVDLH